MQRPRIAIPGRLAESASVLRGPGIVLSQKLMGYVWAGGGDPVMLYPAADGLDWASRLAGIDGLLLPGGGDIDPCTYGGDATHESVYGVNGLQDDVDLSLVHHSLEVGLPLFTICRGTQVLNVALGGSLEIDMPVRHWRQAHTVPLTDAAAPLGVGTDPLDVFCNHHQALERVADSLTVIAWAADGTPEAVARTGSYCLGVQWHPEDTYQEDPRQVALLKDFIAAASA